MKPAIAPMLKLLGIVFLALVSLLAVACQTITSPAAPANAPAVNTDVSASSANSDRQRWSQNATWAPGQLQEHFSKHGREGPYSSVSDYDRAARDTVIVGTSFTYVDRESRAQRMGFYHSPSNRFTSLTSDGQRITTFFHPDRRDAYVRGLDRSTFK